ncbi:MAG TPA: DUF4062 domain-containing protein [Pyrinomonadaceae bacterium]|jgi:hypothetical protein
MEIGETKQYIPIFVGSTFVDLQHYRRAVRDALSQLETIVRGMEYFGSKPGSPVEECLEVVRSCKVYIGIFGMRYGTVPDGFERSMTHLEYDEAQKLNLPSLIYIIDEENQPILPKHVETGDGAKRLRELKDILTKRHVVSFFTTPENLAAKVLHDVPETLKRIGARIEGKLELTKEPDNAEVLRQFSLLPKIFRGKEVIIEFVNPSDFRAVSGETCATLNIEVGASVCSYLKLSTGDNYYIFGENDLALALCKLPKMANVKARVITVFGITKRADWTDDGPITVLETESGLLIKEILQIEESAKSAT